MHVSLRRSDSLPEVENDPEWNEESHSRYFVAQGKEVAHVVAYRHTDDDGDKQEPAVGEGGALGRDRLRESQGGAPMRKPQQCQEHRCEQACDDVGRLTEPASILRE